MSLQMSTTTKAAVVDEHAIVEFTTGACGYLAVALHDMTDWPLFAEYEHAPWENDVAHIWVQNHDGVAVDINGVHPGDWAKTKYSGEKPGRIMPISRQVALGSADDGYLDWARELIANNPEHFGNPSAFSVKLG